MRHVAQPGAGGRTPSDLPLVALSQTEIERLESQYPDLEEVLPLSPLQEGCCSMPSMRRRDPTSIPCSSSSILKGCSIRARWKRPCTPLCVATAVCAPAFSMRT